VIASQAPTDDHRLALTLRGSVPIGILGVGYRRRVEEPLAHAGYAMAEALARTGIRGRRAVTLDGNISGLPLLASHRSAPLSRVLQQMGKYSDNFVAEMVLKVLGAEGVRRPGSSAAGVQVVQRFLQRIGAPEGAEIVNGSGLFEGNRIAPAQLVSALRAAYLDPAVRPEFVAHLSIAGVDGTLHRRLRDLPHARMVRAKTGTLNDAIALSGYVLGPTPDDAVCFSFLANGVRGRHGAARQLADDIVRAIAASLYSD
ncbi:MAG: D-alanyl-D-alanine carboxypeptidase/D-alanyl-D-alanine-endopeptidase, partial [Deltaproteobacteria bacterium]|nr:D-alanyl-D-alanine carboxypeptidase/D-alanyl-D-alanine-endopeptidase [Deltaproteobacteria bacterium]